MIAAAVEYVFTAILKDNTAAIVAAHGMRINPVK